MENQKYYIREGRRFVQTSIPILKDHEGMFYNSDNSFSDKQKENSIGVCIMSKRKEDIIMLLRDGKPTLNNDWWYRLPEFDELVHAFTEYKSLLNLKTRHCYKIKNQYGGFFAFGSDFYYWSLIDNSRSSRFDLPLKERLILCINHEI